MTTSVLRNSFHQEIASSLYFDILTRRTRVYYYLGKVVPHNLDDEPSPIFDTVRDEMKMRDGIIGFKRINVSDVVFAVQRYNWTANTVYDMYDSTVELKGKIFYVLTDDFNVYKCISNNNGGQSTIKPTGTPIDMIKTSDGYVWKYMYNIPIALRSKFLSPAFMPVTKSIQNTFFENGEISDITILNEGSGYGNDPSVLLSVVGDGDGAVLSPVIDPETSKIVSVKVKDGGSGYTTASINVIDQNDTPGSGAEFFVDIFDGSIRNVFVLDGGIGYSNDIETFINVSGDGEGAEFFPYIEDGHIKDVIIRNPGTGYSFINLEVIGDGDGAVLQGEIDTSNILSDQAIIEQTAILGSVDAVKVVSNGSAYTSATITSSGDGSGFQATPIISQGKIVGVNVINPGAGYTYINLTVNGNGFGAELFGIIAPGRGHGSDAISELGSSTLCFYSSISQEKFNGSSISNDFREYGLIKDPRSFPQNNLITGDSVSAMYKITLDDNTGIVNDSVLFINGQKYTVVYVGGDGVLLVSNVNSVINQGEQVTGTDFITPKIITSVLATPEANKYSGTVLYMNTQSGLSFSSEQLITLQTYITL